MDELLKAGWLKVFSFQWICAWSLYACYQFAMTSLEGSLPNLKLLTPSQAANARALQNAMLWFSAAGAGPALLVMRLSGGGRIRRALACVGLASAAANHCLITWLLGVTLVTAPNDDLLVLSVIAAMSFVFFAVVDVNAAQVLLRPGSGGEEEVDGEEEEEEERRATGRQAGQKQSAGTKVIDDQELALNNRT